MSDLERRLIDLLSSMASYNDKGYLWCGHSPEESARMRAEWRVTLDGLMRDIGEERFPPHLLAELRSPDAVRDDSGLLREQVTAWLSRGAR